MVHREQTSLLLATGMAALALVGAGGDGPRWRALPQGERPADTRLGPLRTLDSGFPFHPVGSPEEWAQRAARLRLRVKVATGMWPTPTRSPLHLVVHGRVERPEYTVEKVYFESLPGHFVTGSLYRPRGRSGPHPAVLSPHGHAEDGRFNDVGLAGVREQIASGAERFEVGGRHPLQARAVQLARMGCVVLQYDMEGYADSVQLEHRGLGVRARMNTASRWGFSSPQAELRLQSLMGLQTWNSTRALDVLLSLPDVDPSRVAVEGHSGGGTQTFILAAIDDRPTVLFPAVMVSTAMQGGCQCENASLLRIGAGNVDIAGLVAPRPLGMTAANDWTLEMETKGFPDLARLYDMLGAPGRVSLATFPQFGHNYNSVSRTVMYGWLNRHLGLGFEEPVLERDYEPLSREEASVWDGAHPAPAGDAVGAAHERAVLEWMTTDADAQLAAVTPRDGAGMAEFRRVVGGAFDVILGRRLEDTGPVAFDATATDRIGNATVTLGRLRVPEHGEELPLLVLAPAGQEPRGAVVWVHESGKQGLLTARGEPRAPVRRLLEAGLQVIGVDLLFQGEFLTGISPDAPVARGRARLVYQGEGLLPWQRSAVYTFGYNPSLFAHRVHDVLTVLQYAYGRGHPPDRVALMGLGPVAGPLAAAARAQVDVPLAAAIDTGGFRFESLDRLDDPMFLPGAVRYGDLPALLALGTQGDLWLAGEGEGAPPLVAAASRALGREDPATAAGGDAAAVAWLVAREASAGSRPAAP
jgi:dienelactone hydrolase